MYELFSSSGQSSKAGESASSASLTPAGTALDRRERSNGRLSARLVLFQNLAFTFRSYFLVFGVEGDDVDRYQVSIYCADEVKTKLFLEVIFGCWPPYYHTSKCIHTEVQNLP